jgi:hypothetical protein
MTTIVSAPGDLIVATSDGIDVRFVGIEINADFSPSPGYPRGGRGVLIRLEGVRGLETQRRDYEFLDAREVWADRLKGQERDAAADPPTMPGVHVLDRVQAMVTDDVGTMYQLAAGQVAGDGTEWDASWVYAPAPPPAAQILRLRFMLDSDLTGKECEVRLD